MKIIKPSYSIETDIPGNGLYVLKELEKPARTCYKSEDRITENADSALKLISNLVRNGHEAMIEFYDITAKFICDRGVSHELVRHRMCSFAQESTRYCNYSQGKFGSEITVVEPVIFEELSEEEKNEAFEYYERYVFDGVDENEDSFLDMTDELQNYARWRFACYQGECSYLEMLQNGITPEIARSVLPTCLKTEIWMKANLREWRHILELRTSERAHPEMRRLMVPFLCELHGEIPIIFDDLYEKVIVK